MWYGTHNRTWLQIKCVLAKETNNRQELTVFVTFRSLQANLFTWGKKALKLSLNSVSESLKWCTNPVIKTFRSDSIAKMVARIKWYLPYLCRQNGSSQRRLQWFQNLQSCSTCVALKGRH